MGKSGEAAQSGDTSVNQRVRPLPPRLSSSSRGRGAGAVAGSDGSVCLFVVQGSAMPRSVSLLPLPRGEGSWFGFPKPEGNHGAVGGERGKGRASLRPSTWRLVQGAPGAGLAAAAAPSPAPRPPGAEGPPGDLFLPRL